jgi:putative transposase
MNTPLVEQLEDYPWSSYPAFIGKAKAVNWLTREYTYQLFIGWTLRDNWIQAAF